MSWGPRARANYHCRKMVTRGMARAARRKAGTTGGYASALRQPENSYTPPSRQMTAHLWPDPLARDRTYARAAGIVFFCTFASWIVSAMVFDMSLISPFVFFVLLIEAVVWMVYQAQFNAARKQEAETEEAPPQDRSEEAAFRWAAPPADQAAGRLDPVQEAERRLEEMSQQRHAAGVSRQEFFRRRQEQQRRAKAEEERLDHELRWRRDARHGNPTADDADRAALWAKVQQERQERLAQLRLDDLRQEDRKQTARDEAIEREKQIEELERLISSPVHIEGDAADVLEGFAEATELNVNGPAGKVQELSRQGNGNSYE